VFVERCPFDNICFQGIINHGDEFERQSLENRSWWDAMSQEIVKLRSNLKDARGRVFLHNFLGNLADKGIPVWGWDWCAVRYFLAADA
jgi:hypothetical protein